MKKSLPIIFFLLISTLILHSQKDTYNVSALLNQKDYYNKEALNANVSIYPVPVRDNSFSIKSEKYISYVKITNIIGQDIYRFQYNDPTQLIKVSLENPKRGMYLVTIKFSDGMRIVKKIMVEQSE